MLSDKDNDDDTSLALTVEDLARAVGAGWKPRPQSALGRGWRDALSGSQVRQLWAALLHHFGAHRHELRQLCAAWEPYLTRASPSPPQLQLHTRFAVLVATDWTEALGGHARDVPILLRCCTRLPQTDGAALGLLLDGGQV